MYNDYGRDIPYQVSDEESVVESRRVSNVGIPTTSQLPSSWNTKFSIEDNAIKTYMMDSDGSPLLAQTQQQMMQQPQGMPMQQGMPNPYAYQPNGYQQPQQMQYPQQPQQLDAYGFPIQPQMQPQMYPQAQQPMNPQMQRPVCFCPTCPVVDCPVRGKNTYKDLKDREEEYVEEFSGKRAKDRVKKSRFDYRD